jgi:hypothetical protein
MKYKLKFVYSLALICALLLPVSADAQGSRKGMDYKAENATAEDVILDRVFTAIEREYIRDYYGDEEPEKKSKKSGLPPGLAKKDSLPPGLQKQLEKNGRLPPGLEKRALPDDLSKRLPKRSDELLRRVVGDDVVLIDEATMTILDILRDVAR